MIDTDVDTTHDERVTESSSNPKEPVIDYKEKWIRSLADTENLRKRLQKEKDEALRFSIQNFAKDVILVNDSLFLALESMEKGSDSDLKGFIQGVQMTQTELMRIFELHGVRKIESLGQKFDPNLHQAMFEVEDDQNESGIIVQVLQDGYTLSGRLLRPALVGVRGKKKA